MTPGVRLTMLAGCLIVGETVGFVVARVASAWPWVAFAGMLLALAAWGWNIRHLMPLFAAQGAGIQKQNIRASA